jgi:plastocyanin
LKITPLIAALALTGIANAHAENVTVTINNFTFGKSVTVTAGSTVTWKNLDEEPHTVVSADGKFRSPALDEGDSYSFKFEKPGVYKYVCSIHPRMVAAVTVR